MSGNPQLQLLGGCSLRAEDGSVLLSSGKGLAVIAYLAACRDRHTSRQALADLLWPDQNRERARSSLRQALFVLRRLLGPEMITGDGEWVTLASTVSTDLDAFQTALKSGAMGAAVAAYGGPFLPDDGGIVSWHFEQWASAERLRMQSAFVTAARAHHRALMDGGDVTAALDVAERLRDADPESDDAWHPLFTSLAVANRYPAMEMEAVELGAARAAGARDLDPATEKLLHRLRRQRRAHVDDSRELDDRTVVPAHPELQGRAGVLRDISTAWKEVQRGRARAVVLEAAPGFGKTRVLLEFARRMRLERVRVINCAAGYREQDDEYAVIAELAVQLARLPGAAGISRPSAMILARLVPDLSETFRVPAESAAHDPGEMLRHRSHAFADLCGAVAEEAPIVILIDDLQWADRSSCQCLVRALDRLSQKPILLLGSSRGGNPLPGPTVPLLALAPDDVTALLASIAAIEPPAWTESHTEHLTRVCGGSPFRILQGLRSAISGGALSVAANRWEVVDWEQCVALLNPAVSMTQRFAALSAPEQRVIAMLGAIGRPVNVSELSDALTVEPADILQALRRLDHEGFASRATAEAWTLAHALIAEEASLVLPAEMRQECATRLGRVLARNVGDAQQLRDTVHLLLGGGERFAALDVVERFIRKSRYHYDAETLVHMVAGSRGDAVFARHVHGLLLRRRRRRSLVAGMRAAVVLLTVAGVLGFGYRVWNASPPRVVEPAPAPPALVPQGLHAYFPFDGSAENRIDRGASGNPVSIRWVTDRSGARGRAAYFDRAAYVELPPIVFNDLPTGSIAIWVAWNGSGGLQALTSKQRNNDNSWGILSINGYAGQGGQPTNGDVGRIYYHGSHEHMTGRANILQSTSVLVPDRWYHVAVTWDERAMRLHLNGQLESTVGCVRCDISPNKSPDVISRIGDWVPDGQRFRFGGMLDDLRIYHRVLADEEIRALAGG